MNPDQDQPDLRAALAALERDAAAPSNLIDDALAAAHSRGDTRTPDSRSGGRGITARWVTIAGAAAAVVLLAIGLAVLSAGSPGAPPAAPRGIDAAGWRTYTQGWFSVRHPARWRPYPLQEHSSFLTGIVALSTAPVPAPCKTSSSATATRTSCSPPTAPLSAGGILISWTETAGPPRGPGTPSVLSYAPGNTTRIDNRAARIAISPPDTSCVRSHGNRTITVTIAIARDAALDMHACIAATGDRRTTLTQTAIASARTVHYGRPHPRRQPNPPSDRETATPPPAGQFQLRLVLPATSVPADGTPIRGYVLATNNTGQPITIRDAHCDAWVQAGLTGAHVHFHVASLEVRCSSSGLRPGTTRIPVAIQTTYNGCAQGRQPGTADFPHCRGRNDSTIPPLPPGTYYVHVGTQHVAPSPALPQPVAIRLLPLTREGGRTIPRRLHRTH